MLDLLNSIKECEPDVHLGSYVESYGDFAIRYGMRYWIKDYADVIIIQDKVQSRLWYTLKREGIKIPFPISDINMALRTQQEFDTQQKQERDYIIDSLSSFEWAHSFSDEQIAQLAEGAKLKKYTKGELLVRQGDAGDSLFIVTQGDVSILVKGAVGRNLKVQDRSRGDYFGEMSLLTGEPRSASVQAQGEVEVIIIDKNAFTSVLMNDETMLETLLDILEKQKTTNESLVNADHERFSQRRGTTRDMLVRRIRSYFGLNQAN